MKIKRIQREAYFSSSVSDGWVRIEPQVYVDDDADGSGDWKDISQIFKKYFPKGKVMITIEVLDD